MTELASMRIEMQQNSMRPSSFPSATELGRSIRKMPTFQATAPLTGLSLPSDKQWTDFLAALEVAEQPDSSDWVEALYRKEVAAREVQSSAAGPSYGCSKLPRTFKEPPGDKVQVQLAAGYIIRVMESLSMTELHWRDTSRSGVVNSSHKPDFTGFVTFPEVWTSVVSFAPPLNGIAMALECVASTSTWEHSVHGTCKVLLCSMRSLLKA